MNTIKPYYEDESVQLFHGDCREVLPLIGSTAKAITITDPPYGVRQDGWDAMDESAFSVFTMQWIATCRQKSDRLVSFYAAKYTREIFNICGMIYRRCRQCVWDKPWGSQYAGASEDGVWYAFEPIIYCADRNSAKNAALIARMIREGRERQGISRDAVDRAVRGKRTGLCYRWEEASCIPTAEQVSILRNLLGLGGEFDRALSECDRSENPRHRDIFSHRTVTQGSHPCEKPVGLMGDLIDAFSEKTDCIIDPFSGGGTTLVAAKMAGRRSIGVEQEESFCEIAANRLRQGALFAGGAA